MKNCKNLLNYSFLLLVFLFSCKQESKKKIEVRSIGAKGKKEKIEINSENLKILDINYDDAERIIIPSDMFNDKPIDVFNLLYEIEFIPLETTPKNIIGKIHNILYDSNFYFIHDKRNNKLFRFNSRGKFLNSIGTIGQGPEELLSIWNVALNTEKQFVSIIDSRLRKIFRYKYSGEYIDSKPLFYMISQHEYANENLVLSANKVQKNINIPSIAFYSLFLTNNKSEPFAIAFKKPENSNSYVTQKPLRKFANNIYYHYPYSNGICKVQNNLLVPAIKFEYEENGFPDNAYNKSLDNNEFKKLLDKHVFFSGNYVITNKFYFFQIFRNQRVSYLFFSRKSKSLIYGRGFKYDENKLLASLCRTAIMSKKDGSFITINEAIHLHEIKEKMIKNDKVSNDLKKSEGWEKIKQVKETDNPIIVTYKLKDF